MDLEKEILTEQGLEPIRALKDNLKKAFDGLATLSLLLIKELPEDFKGRYLPVINTLGALLYIAFFDAIFLELLLMLGQKAEEEDLNAWKKGRPTESQAYLIVAELMPLAISHFESAGLGEKFTELLNKWHLDTEGAYKDIADFIDNWNNGNG